MNGVAVALASALGVAFVALGAAKVIGVPSMRARAAHVGLSAGAYRVIGALEVAGGVGLLIGPAMPLARMFAAAGLLLLMIGAVITHLRNSDGVRGAAPALAFAALVALLLVLDLGSR